MAQTRYPGSGEAMAGELRGQGQAELQPETLIRKTKKNLGIACLSCKEHRGSELTVLPPSDLGPQN